MKIQLRFSWLVVLCLVCVPAVGLAGDAGEVTEGDLKLDHGQVNWTGRTITATGSGAPDLKAPNVAVARLGAERVAKLDALRNILETLKGVRVKSDVTIKNEMVTSSKMRTKIEGVARRFKVLNTKYYSDGGVDLTVQMSLDGPLASTLLQPGAKAGDVPSAGSAKNSGLIVDARSLKALPALAPKLLNESGQVIYSSEFLDQSALESNGVVGYFRDLDAAKKAKRVGGSPLIIKALKLGAKGKTDIVLSNADAERLRDPGTNLKFLTEGRVIIVVD
jgi:hypothetical protein